MSSIEVTTQKQLDAAIKKAGPFDVIALMGKGPYVFTEGSPTVVAWESSSPTVVAWESSSPTVVARESSSPTVVARESSSPRVVARGSSSPTVVARGSSSPTVVAWESSSPRVEARGSSSPTVVARGSSSPTVVARGSSSPTVVAWESSSPTVVARESSSPTVVARGSSSPRGSVGKYAALVASKRERATLNIPGATILLVPAIKTVADWLDYHGIPVTRGTAVLFKALDDDDSTAQARGKEIFYTPGSKGQAAADWNAKPVCGGGLHLSPHPSMALTYNADATRFVACPVKVAELVLITDNDPPDKCKAPRISGPIVEVDRLGDPVATRAEAVPA